MADGAVAERARVLAEQMTGWLLGESDEDPTSSMYTESVLVEWCRSARDVLEAVARG